jgi:hypothetical protein
MQFPCSDSPQSTTSREAAALAVTFVAVTFVAVTFAASPSGTALALPALLRGGGGFLGFDGVRPEQVGVQHLACDRRGIGCAEPCILD